MVFTTIDSSAALKDLIKQYLERRGYKTTEGARGLGKSGAEHTFDMLARRDAGFVSHSIGIAILPDGDEKTRVNFLHNCANRAYDVGLSGTIIITVSQLSQDAQRLAQYQHMKTVTPEEAELLIQGESVKPVKLAGTDTFENKAQLIKALLNLNYRVEEDVKVKGKSGTEYTFSIIAYEDDVITGHKLVVDFISSDGEIPLERISLFEVKAYDVGYGDKAIVVSYPLTAEAQQFAAKYAIQVIHFVQTLPVPSGKTGDQTDKSTKLDTEKLPIPTGKAAKLVPEVEALQLIPEVMARRLNVIPISIANNTLTVMMADPSDVFALEAISATTRMRVKPIGGRVDEVREAIDLNYKGYGEIEKQSPMSLLGKKSQMKNWRWMPPSMPRWRRH